MNDLASALRRSTALRRFPRPKRSVAESFYEKQLYLTGARCEHLHFTNTYHLCDEIAAFVQLGLGGLRRLRWLVRLQDEYIRAQ